MKCFISFFKEWLNIESVAFIDFFSKQDAIFWEFSFLNVPPQQIKIINEVAWHSTGYEMGYWTSSAEVSPDQPDCVYPSLPYFFV